MASDASRLARAMAARGENGRLSPLESIGGVRGIAESVLPGLVFTLVFTVTKNLTVSAVAALAVGAAFAAARLLQRQTLVQALSGLVGIAICALAASRSGAAEGFFLPGLIINAVYGLGVLVSMAVRWPAAGLFFGFLRGEGLEWRSSRERVRAYTIGSIPLVALFAVRLAVKVPLYVTHRVTELGIVNAILGVPAFAMALWLAWMLSRPRAADGVDVPSGASGAAPSGDRA
ncbi:DUF3159 domain-containing protein [Falsarthrobacter nasiphocae]|uniref:DUF3159 domain-containing protein n=1 Tax=Falsarthrobacter nasiphocae TaxID=189863 RepID=A0AAE4C594_9MICC|nr:DUF3159 domain-containing protein [Falsarthrobacter nasiphocae]MDR6891263.1 hypothetical protein [Falsarthrobacter nasiphocae]